MIIFKYVISGIFIIFIFAGCETKDKIDQSALKIEQMEKRQAEMQKQMERNREKINYYKNKEKEATSYFEYIMYVLLLIISAVVLKKVVLSSAKLINRG